MAPVAVTGDISKAHRRFKHRRDEWGYLGCKASCKDDVVYINCVGTFGVASAGYWWARLSGGTIRLTHHLTGKRALEILLFAEDVEMVGGDRRGRRGVVLSYAILASLGLPFKWSKTKEDSTCSGSDTRLHMRLSDWGYRRNGPTGWLSGRMSWPGQGP